MTQEEFENLSEGDYVYVITDDLGVHRYKVRYKDHYGNVFVHGVMRGDRYYYDIAFKRKFECYKRLAEYCSKEANKMFEQARKLRNVANESYLIYEDLFRKK